jgi:hypothetical protein
VGAASRFNAGPSLHFLPATFHSIGFVKREWAFFNSDNERNIWDVEVVEPLPAVSPVVAKATGAAAPVVVTG